ncbi:11731_t:CDS:2 [Entrophospora sp. SA101]|nr:4951_t:CDS:2 [Entrophospora sp. SA101]CAJ0745441.1 11731_t:CDS:2 [Entrophospora sp. SA101]
MNRRKNKKIESSRLALVEFYLEIKIADNSISSYIIFRRTIKILLAHYRYTWEEISFISSKIWDILDDGIKKEFQRICSSVDELFKNKRKNQPLQINFYQAPSSPSSLEQSTNNNNEESVNTEVALTEIEKTVFNELFL